MPTPQELARQELARRELARRQKQALPDDVPQFDERGEIIKPEVVARDTPLMDKIRGAGEAGLAAITGITGGAAGQLGGTVEGIVKSIREGTFGTQAGGDEAERIAMERAQQFTYAPRTETGREYAGAIGEAAQNLAPLAGLPGEMSILARTARPIGTVKVAASKTVPKDAPVKMYESAAKFSTTFPKEKRAAMAETAIRHKLMPSEKGLDKLGEIIGSFETNITGLIDDATNAGKTIPKGAIYKHLNKLRREMGGTKVGAAKNLRQIDKAAKEMDIQLKSLKKDRLTPQELQDIKTSAYSQVSYEAKKLRSQSGTEAATKAIAKGAKEAIESVADVKDFNRELGKLLELKDPLSRSAARIENRDLIGIGAPIKIGAAGAAGGGVGAAAGTAAAIFEMPKVKAALAIKLKRIQDAGQLDLIDRRFLPVLVQYGLLQSGRESPSANE